MVSTTECEEKSKPIAGNKVSKPIMEKKRRARINKCLDQLKSLLESYYSSSIRKRKLEKADILELTVKHLRNLQKIQSCTAAALEFSDYQSGFRSCLANVNQYLLMANNLNGTDRCALSRLSSKLHRSGGREEVSSTKDSDPGRAEAHRLLPSEDRKAHRPTTKALKPHSAGTSPCLPSVQASQSRGIKPVDVPVAAPLQNTHEESSSHKKFHSVIHRNEVANAQERVWRPW